MIPDLNGKIIHLRVADNVLDPEYWNEYRAVFGEHNTIVKLEETKPGVYGFSDDPTMDSTPRVGWTRKQLKAWLEKDYTGQHPEQYNEHRMDDPDAGWEGTLPDSWWSEEELEERRQRWAAM